MSGKESRVRRAVYLLSRVSHVGGLGQSVVGVGRLGIRLINVKIASLR